MTRHIIEQADFIGEDAYGCFTPAWGVCMDSQEAAEIVSSIAKVDHPVPGIWYQVGEAVPNPTAFDADGNPALVSERIRFI
jgi:hypothetical protein